MGMGMGMVLVYKDRWEQMCSFFYICECSLRTSRLISQDNPHNATTFGYLKINS